MKRLIGRCFLATLILWVVVGLGLQFGSAEEPVVNVAGSRVPVVVLTEASAGSFTPLSSRPIVKTEKFARLAPQPVAPPENAVGTLKLTRLVLPTITPAEIIPASLRLLEKDGIPQWSGPEPEGKGCWYLDEVGSQLPPKNWGVGGKNTVIWCHRTVSIDDRIIDIIGRLKTDDAIWLWTVTPAGDYYAVEARVRWMGILPREYEPDFLAYTDDRVVTLITCALEWGLPENPKNRLFVRATIDGLANYSAWHAVQAGETLSAIAKDYGTTVKALAEANEIANPDRLRTGRVLFIPLVQGPVVDPIFRPLP